MRNKWIIKAAVQKILSLVPLGQQLNSAMQKYLTGGLQFTEDYFFDRMMHARHHLHMYRKYQQGQEPVNCLELGSGWYPVIPLAYYLSGSDKVLTIDIRKHYSYERLIETLRMFSSQLKAGRLKDFIPVIPEREAKLDEILSYRNKANLDQLLRSFRITYIHANQRADLPEDHFDLLSSNNTLQHIEASRLRQILQNLRKTGKKDAVHSHFIDMCDQFHHFDHSLSIYNFLKYSPAQWSVINNRMVYQNRLRLDDYRQLFAETGYYIGEEKNRPGFPDELRQVRLHPDFSSKDAEVNAVSHTHMIAISKKAG